MSLNLLFNLLMTLNMDAVAAELQDVYLVLLSWTCWNRKYGLGCISLHPDSCRGDLIELASDKKPENPPCEFECVSD